MVSSSRSDGRRRGLGLHLSILFWRRYSVRLGVEARSKKSVIIGDSIMSVVSTIQRLNAKGSKVRTAARDAQFMGDGAGGSQGDEDES